MTDQPITAQLNAQARSLVARAQALLSEGNRREVRVVKGERTIASFPLTLGIIGAVFAPELAILGVIVVFATKCSVTITRLELPLPVAEAGKTVGEDKLVDDASSQVSSPLEIAR